MYHAFENSFFGRMARKDVKAGKLPVLGAYTNILVTSVDEQVKTKKKAEIQALSSFGFQYITNEYLPRKLKEGDWI